MNDEGRIAGRGARGSAGTRSARRRASYSVGRTTATGLVLLLIAVALTGATLSSCGRDDGGPDYSEHVAGLEAVPPGFALEVSATTSHGATGGGVERVGALIVPEAGVYRIELLGPAWTGGASALLTVRTPETQLMYRAQAVLEGDPWPMELAFLESPLTYHGDYDLDDIEWLGPSCTATLTEDEPGGKPGAYEARLDEQTGIVVWERQEWDSYRGTFEITRRLVPVAEITVPTAEDVVAYAHADWQKKLALADSAPFPVYGLALPGLLLHTLQIDEQATWVRYATEAEPGRIAAELIEYPAADAQRWPAESAEWHEAWSDDHASHASGRMIARGDRLVWLRVYSWALEALRITEADVDAAVIELEAAATAQAEAVFVSDEPPPRLRSEGRMPFPQGADFAETLPKAVLYGD